MQRGLFRWAGALMLGLMAACGEPLQEETREPASADAELLPGLLPEGFARGSTRQELASPNALQAVVTESGFITLSIDGLGSNAGSGTVQVDKPAGATVRRAFLAAASTGASEFQIPNGYVRLDGQPVSWSRSVRSSIGSWNHFAEVTHLVKAKLDAAPAGRVPFTVAETSASAIDGEILAVIFDSPGESTVNTAILLFGAQSTTGDTFNISLAEPLDKNDPNLALDLSLGISFGFQTGSAQESQRSTVDINGARLTSQAGGQDDGENANGALLTVGGLDDSNANPSPLAAGPGPRTDDELYDLKPFVSQGSQQIVINTFNASNDDNMFFAALSLRSAAAVVGEGIVLGPTQATGEVGTLHTVTATLQDDLGRPLANRTVSFTITSGPNAGRSGQAVSDSTGRASFSYTGTGGAGRDSLQASFVKSDGETGVSNLALKDWTVNRRPPDAVCRDLQLDAGATCGASGSINNGSTDPDGDLAGCTQSPAGPFGPGTTSVTLTCVDSTGLSDSCTATVTVVDRLPPSIACPADARAECVGGGATVDTGQATGGDNCGAPTVSSPGPASYPLGVSSVTHTATDGSGNRASCTSTVVVQDTQAPEVALVGPASATLECNVDAFADPGATASDVCEGDLTGRVTVSGAVDTGAVGSYTLRYTATDASYLSASVSRTVSVVDTRAPSIVCPGPMFFEAPTPAGADVTPAAATASDVCALASVTGPAAGRYAPGTTPVTYTATDGAGQPASCDTVINVVDRSSPPPKLTMCDLPRYTNGAFVKACGFILPGGSSAAITYAFFRVNGGAPMRVVPDASGGTVIQLLTLDEGTYIIELTAIDALGGIATDTRTVTVDRTAPVIRILSPRPDEAQPSQLVDITSEVTDVAPSTVTTNWLHRADVDAGTSLVTHTVFLAQTGYSQVIVNAVDAAGNAASATQVVYVAEP